MTDQEKKWLEYAYKCGRTDAQRGTSSEHAKMIHELSEPMERYEKETGRTADILWIEYFYQSGVSDFQTGTGTFADHINYWFANCPKEGNKNE